jgi:type III secretion protein Q
VTVADHTLRIATSWPSTPRTGAPNLVQFDLRIGDAHGELTVPRSVIDRLISTVISTDSWRRLDAAQAMIVLELVLSSGLEALEAHICTRIAFTALHEDLVRQDLSREDLSREDLAREDLARPRPPDLLTVSFAIQGGELGAWRSQLALPIETAIQLAGLLEKHARAEPAEIDIGARACLRAAATTLTMRELRSLAAGDVVLVDDRCGPEMALLVIAEHLAAPAELLPEGGRLVAAPVRARGSRWEWAMVDVRERAGEGLGEETGLDDIPIRVTFELGQVELSFGEIRSLVAGALVPLSRPLEDAVDIVANGRRLGRGTLVSIGGSVGVQITRLFGYD